ncbi:MAG: CinA family nicotinamide mononucleotide deamidase-related protein [Nitriliruptoraceae bacterium]
MTNGPESAPGVVEGVTVRPGGQPPRAAVLSVGDELLLGDLTDTNATWISRRLTEQGVAVVHHLTVGDDVDQMVSALAWLAERVHLVVVGGGLGPTADDRTREAVALAAGVELRHDDELEEAIAARFASMGRTMGPQNRGQARIPVGATPFPPVGTAPAFALTLTEPSPTRVIALPGVPWELHELWERHVVDEVVALAGNRVTVTRVLHVVGRGESDVAAVVEPVVGERDDATLAFLAKGHEVQVRLTVSASDRGEALARSQPLVDEVAAALAGAVAGVDDEELESVVVRLLTERGATLATAESATGGDIAARLARVPGASQALLGGAIVYADAAKSLLLGIDPALVAEHGAVSEEVTRELALAVRRRTGADHALAVTGVAGPSSVDELPVGSCFWALAGPEGEVEVHGRRIPGDRGQVLLRLGTAALDLLRRRLVGP